MILAASTASFAGPVALNPGPLGLSFDPTPSMFAQTITTIFNASTGTLTATGTAVNQDDGSGTVVIAQSFRLTATFSGGTATSASLTVGSDAAPYLSASNLSSGGFGYSATKGGTIEFMFDTVGGSSSVFSSSKPLDVQLTVSSLFTPQFTTSWMNSQEYAYIRQNVSTTPEPATLFVVIAGAAGLLFRQRRRFVSAHA
jgi:hypothetical protein